MTIKEKWEGRREGRKCSRNEGRRQNEWPVNSTVYERAREKYRNPKKWIIDTLNREQRRTAEQGFSTRRTTNERPWWPCWFDTCLWPIAPCEFSLRSFAERRALRWLTTRSNGDRRAIEAVWGNDAVEKDIVCWCRYSEGSALDLADKRCYEGRVIGDWSLFDNYWEQFWRGPDFSNRWIHCCRYPCVWTSAADLGSVRYLTWECRVYLGRRTKNENIDECFLSYLI